MTGFYLMHRGWQDNPVFGAVSREPFDRRSAWVWLIENAAYTTTRVNVAGKPTNLRRGQLSHSLRFLAKAWGWDDARVRRFLSRLADELMIECVTDAGQTIITICNYDTYQVPARVGDAPADAAATQQRRSDDAKNNEGNEVNNIPNGGLVGKPSAREADQPANQPTPDFDGVVRAVQQAPAAKLKRATAQDACQRAAARGATLAEIAAAASEFRGRSAEDVIGAVERLRCAPPATAAHHSPPPLGAEEAQWIGRLQGFARNRFWLAPQWGPPPDDPTCRAPPSLIAQHCPATEPTKH